MKRISYYLVVTSFVLLGAGCSTSIHQKGLTAGHEISDTLASAQKINKEQAKRANAHLPMSISNALMPGLEINKQVQAHHAQERFDVSVNDMDARAFFSSLVKGTDFNMVISPKLTGSITLHLKSVTIPDVLNAVHAIYGYEFKVTNYGYQVFPAQLQTRMFTVNYLDVKRAGSSSTFISSGQFSSSNGSSGSGTSGSNSSSSGSTSLLGSSNSSSSISNAGQNSDQVVAPTSRVNTSSYSDFWKSLKETLKVMIGSDKGHEVVVNPGAGIVIVRATSEQLNQVANYLDQLQSTMTRQVIIDAKILEVTLDKGYQAGIDWKVMGATQSGTSLTPTSTQDDIPDVLKPIGTIFSLAMSSGKDFTSMINLLSRQGQVQVLSSPRIATLNNQKAVIKVGKDEFFVTDVDNSTTDTSSSSNTLTSQGIQLTPFFSGIALGVTPQISADGSITLHIHPVVSTVNDQQKQITLNGQTDTLPLALSTVRESDSIVHAKDGQVVVIGGLMETKMEEQIAATPFLSKIPFLGAMFRRTYQNEKKTELVILLRPVVVNNENNQKELKVASDAVVNMRKGYHFGSHPETFGNLGETSYFRNKKLNEG